LVLDREIRLVNTGYVMKTAKGFTLIELLIVIAVLGILAVAILSAINPIEQINRSRDTGSRSDSEQLIGAIDRFYASRGFYPWTTGVNDNNTELAWTSVGTAWTVAGSGVLDRLSSETGELKESFVTRISDTENYNTMIVYNSGGQSDSTYVCFEPASQAFKDEAADRCVNNIPDDLDTGTVCAPGAEWSCLP
jgi:prepilin-type N-terminal cleavage/methylation domain-containing protein